MSAADHVALANGVQVPLELMQQMLYEHFPPQWTAVQGSDYLNLYSFNSAMNLLNNIPHALEFSIKQIGWEFGRHRIPATKCIS